MSTEDNGVELTGAPVKTADNVLLDLIRGTIGSRDANADGPARIDVQTPSGAMRLYLDGPASGPAVLLLHGFPEIAYSWRHQFQFLAQEGYQVIAPDLPGTGASDYRGDDSAYTSLAIVEAIACGLDALGLTKVHVVGHDWGARHAWAFAREQPRRTISVFAVNGPWQPRSARRPLSMVPQDRFSFLAFLASSSANRILDEDPARTLRFFLGHLYGTPDAAEVQRLHTDLPRGEAPFGQATFGSLPPWLSETELQIYVSAFLRTGFGPSLARYRNMDDDWAREPAWRPQLPCAALVGQRDPAVLFKLYEPMLDSLDHCELVGIVPNAGHSLPSERPTQVNSELLAFVRRNGP